MKKIYSAFFLGDGKHCTWEFAPEKCTLPCDKGEEVLLEVVGKYQDDEVSCLIVEAILPSSQRLTHQKDGATLLHITTFCKEGVSPVESGRRATSRGYQRYNRKVHSFTTHADYYTV